MQAAKTKEKSTFAFLEGGGEMGQLTRNYDWSQTPLGTPDQWPQALRTTLGILLHSAFPMFLFWGKDLVCFYNDAFRPSLGADGKHPSLGKKGKEVWPEIWDFIGPLIEKVATTGEPVWFENQLVPFYRNGKIENIYWTFSYSPAYGDNGEINGVFVTCTETTKTINTFKELEESRKSLAFAIEAAELATWDFNPLTNKFTADSRYTEWFGLTAQESTDNNLSLKIIAEEDREKVVNALKNALNYSSGGVFDIEYAIRPQNKPHRILRAKGKTWFTETREAYRLTGTLQDVTEQVLSRIKVQESEHLFRSLIEEAPVATALYTGKEIRLQYANDIMLRYWGKDASVIGKTFRQALPELEDQHFPASIEKVFVTGEPYIGLQERADLVVDGKLKTFYFNFTYKALRNKEGEVYGIHHMAVDVTREVMAKKQLEERETLFRNMIQLAPVAITLTRGEDLVIENINEPMLRLMNLKDENVIGKKLVEVLPGLKEQPIFAIVKNVLVTGEAFTGNEVPVTTMINGTEQQKFYNLSYTPLIEEEKPTGVLHVAIDVTDQVRARRKIEESEQQVRSFIESAPFPIGVYIGREMRIQFANQAILKAFGKGDQVIGKLYSEILPELENQKIFEQLDQVYTTGIPFHAKNQRVDIIVDGKLQPFFFNYNFTPVYDADGKIYGVMNTAADVTDLNLANKKIEESESRFRNLVEQAPVAIAVFSGKDLVAEIANEAYLPLAGKTKEQFIGKPLFESLPEAKEVLQPIIDNIFETGQAFYASEFPLVLRRHNKEEQCYFNFAYEPLQQANGEVIGFMVVAHEVTQQVIARKRIEESEAELQKRVEERTMELAAAIDELKRSNAHLEEFAHAASHDLKEPIRKIHFFTERLKNQLSDKLSAEDERMFGRVEHASNRMNALIDDLLLYSHVSQKPHEKEFVNLNEKVTKVMEDLELDIEEKKAVITVGQLPTIEGYRRQLQQLFHNLLTNALKYNKPGNTPQISITANLASGTEAGLLPGMSYHRITVTDNGIGFEQEHSEKIFQMFQRLHGKQEYEGTGVGLSIARKVVENHNGKIVAKSEPGKGASFIIYLPVKEG